MRYSNYFPNQHFLKVKIRERKIKLWQLRFVTGVNETKLSRCLNGIVTMPASLESRIKRFLKLFDEIGDKAFGVKEKKRKQTKTK